MTIRRRRRPAAYSGAALSAAFLCLCLPAAAQSPALPPGPPGWALMPASLLPMRLPVADAPGWTVHGEAADFEAVDATPVREFSDDWRRYAPRAGHNVALQSARIELGASRERWELAASVRADILIGAPRSTWDAVHVYKQRQTPADGSEYTLDAGSTGVIWVGLRGAHSWVLRPGADHGLQFTGALTLLSARRVQQINATGTVRFDAVDGYGFDVQAQRQDSYKQFGGYGRKEASGSGYTVDLGLLWQPTPSTFVNLSAVDLVSRVRVNEVSTQQATVSSSTSSVDGNGYLNYRPLVSGHYASIDVDRTLSRKWAASVGTRLDGLGAQVLAGARWERVGRLDLPAVWAVLPVVPGLLLQLDAELRFRSIGVGLVSRHGSLMLRTRSMKVAQSEVLGWQASFNLPL